MNFSQLQIKLDDFDTQNLQCFHYTNNEYCKINVFFAVSDKNTILEKWKNFSDAIASLYQNSEYMSENKEFEKWNFYIIYVSNDDLSKELKNKIENDKFSSRKIVEDNFSFEFSDEEANNLIIKHITNIDLKDILSKTQDKIQEEYKPVNTKLWKLVHSNKSLSRDISQQEKIVEQIIRLTNEN